MCVSFLANKVNQYYIKYLFKINKPVCMIYRLIMVVVAGGGVRGGAAPYAICHNWSGGVGGRGEILESFDGCKSHER